MHGAIDSMYLMLFAIALTAYYCYCHFSSFSWINVYYVHCYLCLLCILLHYICQIGNILHHFALSHFFYFLTIFSHFWPFLGISDSFGFDVSCSEQFLAISCHFTVSFFIFRPLLAFLTHFFAILIISIMISIVIHSFRPFYIILLCVILISWLFLAISGPFLCISYHS